ncbi:hypothetical protein BS78_02G150100 [Paspalum vaginatum]|nr:hypothetical protein BS78_02G150100 [Paspalum vaginatum]
MCFCGKPCKMEEPPPLCDFEEWTDTEVKEKDRKFLQSCMEFDAEIKRRIALWKKKEEARKEKLAEERRRIVAESKAEREVKLARTKRAKVALKENPDALRKGKWPRCT